MKHTLTITSENCAPQRYGDHMIVTLPQRSDDWAGDPPEEYLAPLKRHGYLPLDVAGPLPQSTKLTRLMQTPSIDDAIEYVLLAIAQLQPEIGAPAIAQDAYEGKAALLAEWETHPLWGLTFSVAKAGTIHPDPTVIVRLSARRH